MIKPLQLLLLCGLFGALSPLYTQERGQNPTTPKPDENTLGVETSIVVVNATIRNQNRQYVPGLTRQNFTILEDNIRQEILSFNDEVNPFAGVILLDVSGSMENKLSLVRAACAAFVDRLGEGDSIAIYSFGDSKVRLLQDFTLIRDIPDAVWDLRAKGMTTLYDAIVTAADALDRRPEQRRAILVVSDGADTQSRASLDQATRRAVEAQLIVYAIDLSDGGAGPINSGAAVLKSLTARTGGRLFTSPGGSRLREAFDQTIDELRHQYTLTYAPTNDRKDGRWRTIEVRIDRPGLDIRTREGYWARRAAKR
jgi:Ca-activated chloride channel family protein